MVVQACHPDHQGSKVRGSLFQGMPGPKSKLKAGVGNLGKILIQIKVKDV